MEQSKRYVVGRVDQLIANDQHNHHYWPEHAPPDDPALSLQCPQCVRLTWRQTRHCIHCAVDLRAWLNRQRLHTALRWVKSLVGRWAPGWR